MDYQASALIRVLVIDDEPAIRRVLRTSLTELGFTVEEASRGEDGILLVQTKAFDAVLLDINMPGIGGIKTLLKLRLMAPRLPILMLTVQDSEESKIEALERGADDYITKPFSMRECIARIRSAVRRSQTPEHPEDAPLTIGEIQVIPVRRTVTKAGRPVHLTRKEYEILYFLMLNAGRAVTYGKLLSAVWGTEFRQEMDYVRTFVRQLRKKIEDDPSNPRYLLTDAYVGYRFAENLPAECGGSGKDLAHPDLGNSSESFD
jgi:two-component system KDP operon response regulator KdpE